MLATNYVYATLEGYYPRLLAKDGWHEALYLPIANINLTVRLQLYTEQGQLVDLVPPALSPQTATLDWEDGSRDTLDFSPSASADIVEVEFPASVLAQARRGVLRMRVDHGLGSLYIYPIEVVVG